MSYTIQRFFLFLSMLQQVTILPISMVYNFRIAQITKQPIFEKSAAQPHKVIGLIFDQLNKKHTGIFQNFAGGLGSYIYDFGQNYFRIDGAFAHIHEKFDDITTFSGTEADDILFTVGRNFAIKKRASLTLSGLFGIPTHKIHQLQHVDFGYAQVGLGVQLDGLYAFNKISDFVYGVRYIYFVPGKGLDSACKKHTITIGNIGDILIASKNAWERHGLEMGYTARFNFGARACPVIDEFAAKTNYIRNNFYLVYKYKFLLRNIPNRFLFNISYGFDSSPKKFGNKYIITLWASWNVNF